MATTITSFELGEVPPNASAGEWLDLSGFRLVIGPPIVYGPPPTDANGNPLSPFIRLESREAADAPHVVEGGR